MSKVPKMIGYAEGGGRLSSLAGILNGLVADVSRLYDEQEINQALRSVRASTEEKVVVIVTVVEGGSDGEAIEGAVVNLVADDEVTVGGVTDSDGEAIIEAYAGSYNINVYAAGYDDEEAEAASVISESSKTFTITMTEEVS